MAYGRRRGYGSYTDWREYHARQRAQVSAKYGGIDEDVRSAFFSLKPSALQGFFSHYRTRYGDSAAAYARKTYAAWKSGETEPSGQTSERLLEALPSFLTLQTKCDLPRKLREHYRRPESHSLTVSGYSWREPIKPLVQQIIHRAYTAELPESVASRLQWLSSGSMQAASAPLAEAEAQAAKNAASFLDQEFRNIERLLAGLPARKVVQHGINLPYGTITVTVNRSMKMDNEEQQRALVPKEQSTSVERQTPGGLLQGALKNLDHEQVKKLSEAAAEQGLALDVEKIQAERRFENASRDMNDFVEKASRLDRSQASDYKMQAEFESASGRTNVQVSKQSSKITPIIAVAIAVVLPLLFASRH